MHYPSVPVLTPKTLSAHPSIQPLHNTCPSPHTLNLLHMRFAHHYEMAMEHRLAIHLQHVEEIQQQRFNELQSLIQTLHKDAPCHSMPLDDKDHSPNNSLTSRPIPPIPPTPPIPPIPHIPSIPSAPLPHSSPSQHHSTHTPPSSQLTRLKASELPKFHGHDDDDIIDWVQKISSIKRGSEATDSDILRLLLSVLCGNAFNYYSHLAEQEHATLNTWASWAKELQDCFLPPNCLEDLNIYLQQFLFPANTEDSLLIRDILSSISATLRAQLQTGVTLNMTLRDFCCHVLQIEPGFCPQLFPTSHRHPADRVHDQRNHHSHTSFTTSMTTRTSRFTPENHPEKPSTPCFTCGAYHWSDQCTLKQQQQQQHNATWPSSNANNPATSTSLNSRSSFPSWACPSPNTNSSNYKPPANLVNSIANKDGYRFNSPKPSVHTLLHSTPTCSSTHSPVHAIPQLQLQQTHLNKTPAFATVKFNSNHPFASTHHAIINTGASLSVIRQEYAQKHLSHLLCHPFKNFQLNGIGQSSSTGYHLIDIHFLTKEGYNTIILTALFIINNISVNLILGLDFLLPHHAKIDLQDGILSFPCHPSTILLSCQSGPLIPPHLPPLPSPIPCPFVPSIRVKEAFTILPVHQAHIETTIDVLPHTPQYLVSPTSTGKYLHVARCVGSSTASKHFVLVLNTGDRPIPVSGGHLLGHPLPLHTACPTPAVHTINTVAIPETNSDAEPFPITDLKINPDLTPEQSEALHQVLIEQCHIFGFGSQQLGSTNLATMNVDTGNHPPISTPPYRISPQGHATIDEKLTELLNQGIIEEADSPWASPAILV
ncbi:hypothetical protein L804_00565 [Cryptococcus deuterogattii 2001/935-1]|nr:hypothetical protein L804_00565 [Cryptococcus deuterogattii 2001/935-1]